MRTEEVPEEETTESKPGVLGEDETFLFRWDLIFWIWICLTFSDEIPRELLCK